MPVRNGAVFLESAIESILCQTFADFELLIFDNASDDTTANIACRYAAEDPRIVCFRQEGNVGAARNYNDALQAARGRYFRWAAHDDVLLPTNLERCLGVLESHPGVVLVYPKTIIIDGDGEMYHCVLDRKDLRQSSPVQRFREINTSGWGLCNPVFGLIRTEDLRRTVAIGSYPSSDHVLLAELALMGLVWELDEALFARRLHPGTSVVSNPDSRDLAAWFSGTRSPFPRFRSWRLVWQLSYLSIRVAELSLFQRFGVFLAVIQWARIWRGELIKELLFPFYVNGQETGNKRVTTAKEIGAA